MKVLVVPTNRPERLTDFFCAWGTKGGWDKVVVVEDAPDRSSELPAGFHHYCWKDIDEEFGDESWIFSRGDSAIRSYGFWKAYGLGAEYIGTLDDDCLPIEYPESWFSSHLNAMQLSKWRSVVNGCRFRGHPYFSRGSAVSVMNHGLWVGNADFDAVSTLSGAQEPELPKGTSVLASGFYYPICGMNLCFRREFTPLAYFALMGKGQPYRRFDDIWFGVIAKKICDHLRWTITSGEPFVNHSRASDPMVNLVKEAPGIARNETFWMQIDSVSLHGITSPWQCMVEMGVAIRDTTDEYMHKLGSALVAWASTPWT